MPIWLKFQTVFFNIEEAGRLKIISNFDLFNECLQVLNGMNITGNIRLYIPLAAFQL